jgi:signal transduction histidine kinase
MTLALEHFDIRPVINDVVATLAPLVQKNANQIVVECDDDLGPIHSDLLKTRQILLNLLGNAAKFTRNGTITLAVECRVEGKTPSVVVVVRDTGVGMTAEQAGKIFDAFTQADVRTTRKYGGSGLGLAIVSRFCALMGGRVSVESELGQGSQFTVVLPVDVADVVDAAVYAA